MSSEVVKASDLIPSAFASASSATKEDDLLYDLHNLSASDIHPLDPSEMAKNREAYLTIQSQENAQLLINRIFSLERESTPTGDVVTLPAAEIRIPREKPIPKPKAPTKWELFAKEKGIVKQKRSRMVFDELTEEYKPRFGFKRALRVEDDWVIEDKQTPGNSRQSAPAGEQLDPFAKRKMEKKQKIIKNQLQHIRNLDRTSKKMDTPSGIPLTLGAAGNPKRSMKGKAGTQRALEQVQRSTASMGKFDKVLENEPERLVRGKKRRFSPVERTDTEKEKSLFILKHLDQQ